ncbi:MAG: hypothetical protein J7604_07010 [Sporocytophaga sp.]|uniref:hypothetical protein n=1 Tax=Sporocytophaga sp. TaxID=2231183 RepID=UPI001AFD1A4B|nr:hypothetical protein [Sporocytophaga sp.]MBO9699942.1 hypothetical protein [Sporocytophaga sp.]
MTIESITLISVILTAAASLFSIWDNRRNYKKSTYVNSVTATRIQYIQSLRNNIAEFCGLFDRYKKLEDNSKELSTEKFEILASADKLKYLIILHLTPENSNWDTKIIQLIDEIRISLDKNPKDKIDELITITQYLLMQEWEGAKREASNGILSDNEKVELNAKYLKKYNDHKKSVKSV